VRGPEQGPFTLLKIYNTLASINPRMAITIPLCKNMSEEVIHPPGKKRNSKLIITSRIPIAGKSPLRVEKKSENRSINLEKYASIQITPL
jgi:hypothetical protein